MGGQFIGLGPAAAERAIQIHVGLDAGKLDLHKLVLRTKQRLLGGQDREKVGDPFAILNLGNAERLGSCLHFVCQEFFLLREACDLAERSLHVLERAQYRLAIGGDQFKLLAFAQAILARQVSTVEDGLQQRCADAPSEVRTLNECADSGAGEAARTRQADRREECCTRGIHVRMGCREIGFGFGDVGAAAQQFGRKAGPHGRRFDLVQILPLNIETFRQLAEQDRQRVAGLALRFFQRRNLRLLPGDLGFLLCKVEARGNAVGYFRLRDR